MTCPIDICWIDDIYVALEEEQSDNRASNSHKKDCHLSKNQPICKKESFLGNFIHSLNTHDIDSPKNHSGNDITPSDMNTVSTESSSSYAEIIIPTTGGALLTPSTLSSNTSTSHCVASSSGGSSTTISEKTSSPNNITIYTHSSKEKNASPSLSLLVSGISPIKRVQSFSSKSAQRYSSAADINKKERNMSEPRPSKESGIIKPKSDNNSNCLIAPVTNIPIRYVHVPCHHNHRIVVKSLSPTKSTNTSTCKADGRPPLSPKSKEKLENFTNHTKCGYGKTGFITEDTVSCLEAPPPLNRYLPNDDFLFDGDKRSQSQNECKIQGQLQVLKGYAYGGESIEVRLGVADTPVSMSISQHVQVMGEKNGGSSGVTAKASTTCADEGGKLFHCRSHCDAGDYLSGPEEEFPLQYNFYLEKDEEEDEESLIGDDLVLDDDMCSEKVEDYFFPHIILEEEDEG